MYPVNNIFETIQGEGHHAGRSALFIRFQGCPVGCPWCDTKETWETDPDDEVTADIMLARQGANGKAWAQYDPALLARQIEAFSDEQQRNLSYRSGTELALVVLTGGEPALQDFKPLADTMAERFKTTRTLAQIAMETSGTARLRGVPAFWWITLSPKYNQPGGYEVRWDVIQRANEVKWVVGKAEDLKRLTVFMREYEERSVSSPNNGTDQGAVAPLPVYVQPLSQSPKATALCVDYIKAHPRVRLSVQTHKYLDIY